MYVKLENCPLSNATGLLYNKNRGSFYGFISYTGIIWQDGWSCLSHIKAKCVTFVVGSLLVKWLSHLRGGNVCNLAQRNY